MRAIIPIGHILRAPCRVHRKKNHILIWLLIGYDIASTYGTALHHSSITMTRFNKIFFYFEKEFITIMGSHSNFYERWYRFSKNLTELPDSNCEYGVQAEIMITTMITLAKISTNYDNQRQFFQLQMNFS